MDKWMLVPHFKFNNLHSVGFFTFTKKYQKKNFESFLKMCDDFEHVFNYLMDSKLICDCCIRLMLWKNWIQSKPVPLIFMVLESKRGRSGLGLLVNADIFDLSISTPVE